MINDVKNKKRINFLADNIYNIHNYRIQYNYILKLEATEEKTLTHYNGEYLVDKNMLPVRKHQAEEEILKKEKELASLIYFEKDKEQA